MRQKKIYNFAVQEIMKTTKDNRRLFLESVFFNALKGQLYLNVANNSTGKEKTSMLQKSDEYVEILKGKFEGKNISSKVLDGLMNYVNSMLIVERLRVRDVTNISQIPKDSFIKEIAKKHALFQTT